MSRLNGSHENECLSDRDFQEFIEHKWIPHTSRVDLTMDKLAASTEQIASILSWAAKGLLGLLMLLVLINATGAIIQQVKEANTSFKGTIGGPNGAQIEITKEKDAS